MTGIRVEDYDENITITGLAAHPGLREDVYRIAHDPQCRESADAVRAAATGADDGYIAALEAFAAHPLISGAAIELTPDEALNLARTIERHLSRRAAPTLTHEIKVLPGFDNRDSTGGADSCALMLVARGPLGAITAEISTGWMSRPLATGSVRRGQKQERRDRVGVDRGLVELYPHGHYLGAHSSVPREDYPGSHGECEWIGGAPCWNNGSFNAADDVLEALVEGGSDAAFALLDGFYQSLIADRPKAADGAA